MKSRMHFLFAALLCFVFSLDPGTYAQAQTAHFPGLDIPAYMHPADASYFASACGTDQLMRTFRKDPAFRDREERMNRVISQASSLNLSNAFGPVYTLPVVFHIVSNNPYAVTDAQMIAALQDLNDAFAHTGVYGTGPGANTQIQFCLAQKDPQGGNTTGITRTTSFLADLQGDMEDDKLKSLVDWDPAHYINIWYVTSIAKESLAFYQCGSWTRMNEGGYATMPAAAGNSADGIVVTGFGILLAHEMGHYLGLYHTFQGMDCKNNDCSTDGDMVCDTPPQRDVFSSPSCNQPVNSCSTDTLSGFTTDVPDLISNFMSYGNTPCINEFTQGQAARMRATIATVRSSLLQPECTLPCSEGSLASFTPNNPYPLPGGAVSFTNTSTGATQYQWSVNGAVVSNATNFSYTFPSSGTYSVSLKAFNANPACFADYAGNVVVSCGTMARFVPNKQTIASKDSIYVDSIQFTNRSVSASTYKWLLSDAAGLKDSLVGTSANLNLLFPNTGSYSLRLVASNGGCTDTTEAFSIPVQDPTADGVVSLSNVYCYHGDSLQVTFVVCNDGYAPIPKGTPVSFYDADPRTTQAHRLGQPFLLPDSVLGMCCNFAYTVLLNAGHAGLNQLYAVFNDDGLTSPLSLPNTTIKEINYSNNIASYSQFQFALNIAPYDTMVMRKSSFPLRVTGSDQESFTLNWATGPLYALSCYACQAPVVQVADTTMVHVQATTQYGCIVNDSVPILTFPPDFTVQVNSTDCFTNDSLLVHFTVCMNNGYDSIWAGIPVSFFGVTPAGNPQGQLGPSFTTPAVAGGSCVLYSQVIARPPTDSLYVLVNGTGSVPETDRTNDGDLSAVTPFTVAISPGDTSVPIGSLLPLAALVNGGMPTAVAWYPFNGLSCTDCLEPVLEVPYTSPYSVIVRNQYKCIDTAHVFIKSFSGGEVNIPSAFTPNGDGRNDIFYILAGKDVQNIGHLTIFSRYGSAVFDAENILPNDPSLGWNGTIQGRPAEPGAYVYMVLINFSDGRKQLFKGTLVLMR